MDELAILEVERPGHVVGLFRIGGLKEEAACLDLGPVGCVVEDDKDVDLDW